MSYIIDGHNLIPKIPGLSLEEVDDERKLIELLQVFCRRSKKQVEVYFDNRPPGVIQQHSFGAVRAHFVRQGRTADDAIRARILHLGKSARNWILVSSDRAIQAAAKEAHARVLSSESFAQVLMQSLSRNSDKSDTTDEAGLEEKEVEHWLRLFSQGNKAERS